MIAFPKLSDLDADPRSQRQALSDSRAQSESPDSGRPAATLVSVPTEGRSNGRGGASTHVGGNGAGSSSPFRAPVAYFSDVELVAERDRLRGTIRSCRRLGQAREALETKIDLIVVERELFERNARQARVRAI